MDLLVADLGEVMPSDKKEGAIVWLRQTGARRFEVIPLIEKIGRVADAQAADFDGDGDLDIRRRRVRLDYGRQNSLPRKPRRAETNRAIRPSSRPRWTIGPEGSTFPSWTSTATASPISWR